MDGAQDVSRLHKIEAFLDHDTAPDSVDLDELRRLCAVGAVPDHPPFLRPRIWRILLRSLPPEKSKWDFSIEESRQRYLEVAHRFIDDLETQGVPTNPLRSNDRLLDSIEKDVARVQLLASFSSSATSAWESHPSSNCSPSVAELSQPDWTAVQRRVRAIRGDKLGVRPGSVKPEITLSPPDSSFESPSSPSRFSEQQNKHQDAILRILYFHSLLHPDRGYNQAMSSILAPMYLVLVLHEADHDNALHAESDVFWAFGEMMGDIGGFIGLIGELDDANGVQGLLRQFSEQLCWADRELWEELHSKSLDPALPYWSLQWVSSLFARVLPLGDVIRLWDLLLSQPPSTFSGAPRISLLIDLCTSMILRLRNRLIIAGNRYKGGLWAEESSTESAQPEGIMSEGFIEGMQILQNYPIDVVGLDSIVQGAWWLIDKRQRERTAAKTRNDQSSFSSLPSTLSRMRDQWFDAPWLSKPATAGFSRNEEEMRPRVSLSHLIDPADAAATFSKARSNLAAAALDYWRGSSSDTMKREVAPEPPRSLSFPERTESLRGWSLWRTSRSQSPFRENTVPLPISPSNDPSFSNRSQCDSRGFSPSTPNGDYDSETSRSSITNPSDLGRSMIPNGLSDRPHSPPVSPNVFEGGPRPLILSNRRVTRDFSQSRRSSVSSTSQFGDSRLSDPETSRVVLIRRRRVDARINSPSSLSRPSLASPGASPRLPWKITTSMTDEDTPAHTPVIDEHASKSHSVSPLVLNESHKNITALATPAVDDDRAMSHNISTIELPTNSDSPLGTLPSRLRPKRSMGLSHSHLQEPNFQWSDGSDEEPRRSPSTPRPPSERRSPDHALHRRLSPRERRGHKQCHAVPKEVFMSEASVSVSEEEGVKADDEDDYHGVLEAYSTDDVGSDE